MALDLIVREVELGDAAAVEGHLIEGAPVGSVDAVGAPAFQVVVERIIEVLNALGGSDRCRVCGSCGDVDLNISGI